MYTLATSIQPSAEAAAVAMLTSVYCTCGTVTRYKQYRLAAQGVACIDHAGRLHVQYIQCSLGGAVGRAHYMWAQLQTCWQGSSTQYTQYSQICTADRTAPCSPAWSDSAGGCPTRRTRPGCCACAAWPPTSANQNSNTVFNMLAVPITCFEV